MAWWEEFGLAWWRVTCHTEDCGNAGIPLELLAEADDPYVQCGPCGVRIADLDPIEEPAG